MALTDATIRNTKPGEKQQKLYDGGGLLLVTPTGSKRWIFKYRFAGKEKSLALGVYPGVPLADARKRGDDAREKLAANIDPGKPKRPGNAPPALLLPIHSKPLRSPGWKSAVSPLKAGSMKKRLRVSGMTRFPGLASDPSRKLTHPRFWRSLNAWIAGALALRLTVCAAK
ncbi:hypothetical protein OKW29_006361 [Paraburkholderia sp. CI3]